MLSLSYNQWKSQRKSLPLQQRQPLVSPLPHTGHTGQAVIDLYGQNRTWSEFQDMLRTLEQQGLLFLWPGMPTHSDQKVVISLAFGDTPFAPTREMAAPLGPFPLPGDWTTAGPNLDLLTRRPDNLTHYPSYLTILTQSYLYYFTIGTTANLPGHTITDSASLLRTGPRALFPELMLGPTQGETLALLHTILIHCYKAATPIQRELWWWIEPKEGPHRAIANTFSSSLRHAAKQGMKCSTDLAASVRQAIEEADSIAQKRGDFLRVSGRTPAADIETVSIPIPEEKGHDLSLPPMSQDTSPPSGPVYMWHDPAHFGRGLYPNHIAVAHVVLLSDSLAQQQKKRGQPFSIAELDQEFSTLFDRLTHEGLCQPVQADPTISKEKWLQARQQAIEKIAAGTSPYPQWDYQFILEQARSITAFPPTLLPEHVRQSLLAHNSPPAVKLFVDDNALAIAAAVDHVETYAQEAPITAVLHSFTKRGIRHLQLRIHCHFNQSPFVLGSAPLPLVPQTVSGLKLLAEQKSVPIHFFPAGGPYDYSIFTKFAAWTEESRQQVQAFVQEIELSPPPAYLPIGLQHLQWQEAGGYSTLQWEDPNGAIIRITTTTGVADISIGELADVQWFRHQPSIPLPKQPSRWIMAMLPSIDPLASLTMVWPKTSKGLDALETIVDASARKGTPLPWPIAVLLFAALQARKARRPLPQWHRVTNAFLLGQDLDTPLDSYATRLSRKKARSHALKWQGQPSLIPQHPVSRAIFYWELGKLMWSEQPLPHTDRAMSLAEAQILCQPRPLRIPLPEGGHLQAETDARMTLWNLWQILHLATIKPLPPKVLDFVFPSRLVHTLPGIYAIEQPWADASWNLAQPTPLHLPVPDDQNNIQAWSDALKREADERQAYVPTGNFRVPVPQGTYLHLWGIAELRLSVDKDGVWAGLISLSKRVVSIMRWEPTFKPELVPLPGWMHPSLDLLFASLWRDMRTAGPPVFPRSRKPRRSRGKDKGPSRPGQAPAPDIRTYPRRKGRAPQTWTLTGPRTWGTPKERKAIRERAAAPVAGHFRTCLYVAECALLAIQAISPNPPTDDWRLRLKRVRNNPLYRDPSQCLWWTTLLSATGSAQKKPRDIDRLEVAEAVFNGLLRRHPGDKRLLRWTGAALRAIVKAKGSDPDDLMTEYQSRLASQRDKSAERALHNGARSPKWGETFVNSHVRPGTGPQRQTAEEGPLIRAKGLWIVHAVLGCETSTTQSLTGQGQENMPG